MKQVIVTDFCTACGNCFSKSDFFKKARSGHAKVLAPNLIKEADFNKIKSIIDECPAKAIEVTTAGYRELADISEIDKKFSLFKIFGSLELSEVNEPDALALRMIAAAKNRGQETYDKLESMIMNIVSNVNLSNKNIAIEDDYVSIKCQMKSRSHRLNMDKYEIKKYFNLPDSHLTIYKNGENFEILVNKGILIRIFALTKMVEAYGQEINNISKEEAVNFSKNFIRENFFPEEIKPETLDIINTIELPTEENAKEDLIEGESDKPEVKKTMTEEELERDRAIRERLQKLRNRPTRDELFKEPVKQKLIREESDDQEVDREQLIRERLQKLRNRPIIEEETKPRITQEEAAQENIVLENLEQESIAESLKGQGSLDEHVQKQTIPEESDQRSVEVIRKRISPEGELQRKAIREREQMASEELGQRALEPIKRRMSADEQLRRKAAQEREQRALEGSDQRALEPVKRRISPEEQLRRQEIRERVAKEREQMALEGLGQRALEPVKRRMSPDEELRRKAIQKQAVREREQMPLEESSQRALEPVKRRMSPDEELRRKAIRERAAKEREQMALEEPNQRALEPVRRRISPDEQLRRKAIREREQIALEERLREQELEKKSEEVEELVQEQEIQEQQGTEQHDTEQQGTEQHDAEQQGTEQHDTERQEIEQQEIDQQDTELQEIEQHDTKQPDAEQRIEVQVVHEEVSQEQEVPEPKQEQHPVQEDNLDREAVIREKFRQLRESQVKKEFEKDETIKNHSMEKDQEQEDSTKESIVDRETLIRERFRQLREKQAEEESAKNQPLKREESLKKEAIKQVIKKAIEEEEIDVNYEETSKALQIYDISNEYEDYDLLEESSVITVLNIFGNLDIDNIYKADKFSTDMLNLVANKNDDAYKKLEHVVFVNILESGFKNMNILIKKNYISIKSGIKVGVYNLIAEREKIIKRFNISNDVKSDEVLDISLEGEGFELVISKTLLNKMFLLTALYEKYDKEINNMSSSTVEKYTDALIEEFILRNNFKIKDMSPETIMITEYDTAMYRETYDIRHLFSEEKMQQVATRRDVAAIFDRNFYSLDGTDLSAAVENLKLKCMSLVNGINTIEYIVKFYTGETDYD